MSSSGESGKSELERLRERVAELERYRAVFHQAPAALLLVDAETGSVVDFNEKALSELFLDGAELRGLQLLDPAAAETGAEARRQLEAMLRRGTGVLETRYAAPTGETRDLQVSTALVSVRGRKIIQCLWRDSTDTRLALEGETTERERGEAERERLRSAIEQTADVVVITDLAGNIQYVNPAFEQTTGYRREEVLGRNPRVLKSGLHDEAFYRDLWGTLTRGESWKGRMVNRRKDGSLYTGEATISPVRDGRDNLVNYVATMRDISHELELEKQLHQAQKLESVGRLAGGVAHDFNNMLSVIIGNAEMALQQLEPSHPVRDDLDEIRKAGERSADLARQLLAFARRQTISPRVLDLNETIAGMLKMLGRMIGEDIDLVWRPGAGLWLLKMDPGQIDQILANLVVNARDAIDGVGEIQIETANAAVDEEYGSGRVDLVPGDYVVLAVSDTGCGMDRATLASIFEPFFTTKSSGEGTGLGLSTVYGIVKQNEGHINAYSEPGRGTTFRIYLPRFDEAEAPERGAVEAPPSVQGGETLLLVEDDVPLLKLSRRRLEKLGYRVLDASSPAEAVQLARTHEGEIDLLLTDVVMPGMSGVELYRKLSETRPALKCIYTSGYTADVIVHRGILDGDVHFLQKPFDVQTLAAKLREVLEG